jgi:hypothetical protein
MKDAAEVVRHTLTLPVDAVVTARGERRGSGA